MWLHKNNVIDIHVIYISSHISKPSLFIISSKSRRGAYWKEGTISRGMLQLMYNTASDVVEA